MAGIVLVTGGAGFIGSHLCEELIKRNFKVICIDNLGTGRLSNLKQILNNKNFVFIKKDIRDNIRLKWKIDYIFHLASYASPPYYQKYSIDTLMTNSLGTYNILEMARKYKALFLLASTSEVYGDPKIHPQKEEYWGNVNPIGVRSCYDEAKRFAESITMEYSRKYNLNVRIVRIFNTYGPRLQKDDGRVISNFIYQALHNLPITIYGDGLQTRSFCYVVDMVNGLLKAMFVKKSKNQIINLGNCDEFTIKEAAYLIKKITNSKSKIVYKPLPQDDPTRRKPDITKAKKILNWEPEIKLEQGLIKTIEWFKNE
jgi:nucleoside-diphosphate-sugar epimerase